MTSEDDTEEIVADNGSRSLPAVATPALLGAPAVAAAMPSPLGATPAPSAATPGPLGASLLVGGMLPEDKLSHGQKNEVTILVFKYLFAVALALAAGLGTVGKLYLDSRVDKALEPIDRKTAEAGSIVEQVKIKAAQTQGPFVGLLTDFGTGAYYLGKLRGGILYNAPTARLVDVSHEIQSFDVNEGAWTLFNAAKGFPPDSIFLAIVNPGADLRAARLIVTKNPRYYFVGAGKEVFDHVAARFGVDAAYGVPLSVAGDTFGIQALVPLVASLVNHVSIADLVRQNLVGSPIDHTVSLRAALTEATLKNDKVEGYVCAIDRWGNLQTNIPPKILPAGVSYVVNINGRSVKGVVLAQSYSDGEDKPGVLVQQDGWLQVARYRASAEKFFGIQGSGSPVSISVNSVAFDRGGR